MDAVTRKRTVIFVVVGVALVVIFGGLFAAVRLNLIPSLNKYLPKGLQGVKRVPPVALEIIDNSDKLQLQLANEQKLRLILEKVPKIFTEKGINHIKIDLTTNSQQKLSFAWSEDRKYAGFTTSTSGNTLNIALFVDPLELKRVGKTENETSKEIELIFIQAILDAERQAFPVIGNQDAVTAVEAMLAFQSDHALEIYKEVKEQESQNLFVSTNE